MTRVKRRRPATAIIGLVFVTLVAVGMGCGGGPSGEVKEQLGRAKVLLTTA